MRLEGVEMRRNAVGTRWIAVEMRRNGLECVGIRWYMA